MWKTINDILNSIDNFVWGVPLMVLILAGGILLTIRLCSLYRFKCDNRNR